MKQEQVPKPQVAGKTATATPKSQKLPARPQVLVGKRPELPSVRFHMMTSIGVNTLARGCVHTHIFVVQMVESLLW